LGVWSTRGTLPGPNLLVHTLRAIFTPFLSYEVRNGGHQERGGEKEHAQSKSRGKSGNPGSSAHSLGHDMAK